jgi:tetratricopeptide (TPR) repeat protein
MKFARVILTGTLLLILIFACKKPVAPETGKDEEQQRLKLRADSIKTFIKEGWQLFEAGNYEDAENRFNLAVSLARTDSYFDSLLAEAESGRGWTRAYKRDFSLAKNDLLNSIANPEAGPETVLNSNSGLALVHHIFNEFTSAIQKANEVLNKDPDYVFSHDTKVNYKRLHLLLAQSYYSIGDFKKAAEQLDILDPANAPHSTDPAELLKQIQEMWEKI